MKKIPTIFKRDPNNPSRVTEEVNPVCQWVFDGEGVATRKWDGTAVLIQDGFVYKRYDCRRNATPPKDFISADAPDAVTGHWPGWVPVGTGPEDKWHREGLANYGATPFDGTFELLHPRYQGRDSAHINPEHVEQAKLRRHGEDVVGGFQRTHDSIKAFLAALNIEGIVWHHSDGRMAKIKARDFGIIRP